MLFVLGSTRALTCSARRPRRADEALGQSLDVGESDLAGVFREGAEHSTRGRVRSPFRLHRSLIAKSVPSRQSPVQ